MKDALTVAKPAEVLLFRRADKSGREWESSSFDYPRNTGTAKAVAVGDLDGDEKPDLVLSCEQANGDKSGVVWMKRTAAGWEGASVSGPAGIKFDRLELLDIDGDGDLDILTCEERHAGRGLGVIWYENRLSAP